MGVAEPQARCDEMKPEKSWSSVGYLVLSLKCLHGSALHFYCSCVAFAFGVIFVVCSWKCGFRLVLRQSTGSFDKVVWRLGMKCSEWS